MFVLNQGQVAFQNTSHEDKVHIARQVQLTPEHFFTDKNLQQLAATLVVEGWEVVVALRPCYYLQCKPNSLLILLIHGVTLLIFRPKYLELPRFRKPTPLLNDLPSDVSLQFKQEEPTFGALLRHRLCSFMHHNRNLLQDQTSFQKAVIQQFHQLLGEVSNQRFWHIILATKAEVPAPPIVGRLKCGRYERRFFAFKLKGQAEGLLVRLRDKWNEVLLFLILAVLLAMVVGCKQTSQGFCEYKQPVFLGSGVIVFATMANRWVKRGKNKLKAERLMREAKDKDK